MRVIHITDKNLDRYINIDTINNINVIRIEKTKKYYVDITNNNNLMIPIAANIENPQEIVEDFIKIINTVKNNIIEYEVVNKESEWYKWQTFIVQKEKQ